MIPELNGSGRIDLSCLRAATAAPSSAIILDGTGKITSAVLPLNFGKDMAVMTAGMDVTAGMFVGVEIVTSGEVEITTEVTAIPAWAGSGAVTPAVGFVKVDAVQGTSVEVYFEGNNTFLSGLTPGELFLSATTAGGWATTIPTTSGYLEQKLGFAYSTTAMSFQWCPAMRIA